MTKQVVEFGVKDYFQLCFWYVILYAFVHWQGWIIGLIMNAIVMQCITYALKEFMNLEMMSGGDEIFFLDDHRNCLNIIAFHKWDKLANQQEIDSFRK